eukprot:TRINITY_DN27243_c0_g1_i1.p1 TRINITY_DN27243_c0_g1~~TRINITY_DN27243_c0_g1_i1.p1  ORF type:complete len:1000 (+),score=156.04 TRINITY_DN27243_c0_g1_i1:371-3001(+)
MATAKKRRSSMVCVPGIGRIVKKLRPMRRNRRSRFAGIGRRTSFNLAAVFSNKTVEDLTCSRARATLVRRLRVLETKHKQQAAEFSGIKCKQDPARLAVAIECAAAAAAAFDCLPSSGLFSKGPLQYATAWGNVVATALEAWICAKVVGGNRSVEDYGSIITVGKSEEDTIEMASRQVWSVATARELPADLLLELLGHPPSDSHVPLMKSVESCPESGFLEDLNMSQCVAVQAACSPTGGFGLVNGAAGTGKSLALLTFLNMKFANERRVTSRLLAETALLFEGWSATHRSMDHFMEATVQAIKRPILVIASSTLAVDRLLDRLRQRGFVDSRGNPLSPPFVLRVCDTRDKKREYYKNGGREEQRYGNDGEPVQVDLGGEADKEDLLPKEDVDARVQELLQLPLEDVLQKLVVVQERLFEVREKIGQLHTILLDLKTEGDTVETFVDKKAVGFLIKELVCCAQDWKQLRCEEEQLSLLFRGQDARSGTASSWPRMLLADRMQASLFHCADLVFTTLDGMVRMYPGNLESFHTVVVDDATHATEPAMLVALRMSLCKRCVLFGDDRQLPPMTPGYTLFERLRALDHHASNCSESLTVQYRMAPEISTFPNAQYYSDFESSGDGDVLTTTCVLQNVPGLLEGTRRKLHLVFPPFSLLCVRPTSVPLKVDNGDNSALDSCQLMPKLCSLEARFCAALITRIRAAAEFLGEAGLLRGIALLTIGRAQRDALRRELSACDSVKDWRSWLPGRVFTVDEFQGQESDIVIFSSFSSISSRISSTCCNSGSCDAAPVATTEEGAGNSALRGVAAPGFYSDERHINVALTRATSLLFVVTDGETLERSEAWGTLSAYAQAVPGAYRHIPCVESAIHNWQACCKVN